jgi:hypothetical protein
MNPVAITLPRATSIASGAYHACAILDDARSTAGATTPTPSSETARRAPAPARPACTP